MSSRKQKDEIQNTSGNAAKLPVIGSALPKTEFKTKFGSYHPNFGNIGEGGNLPEDFSDACNYYCNALLKTYKNT